MNGISGDNDMTDVEIRKTIFPLVNTTIPPYLANQQFLLDSVSDEFYQVWLDTTCLVKIVSHVAQTPLEAGGIILGKVYLWQDKYHIQIEAAIPAIHADASWWGLRFTVDAWEEMLDIKESVYKNLVIVGWYHSHPLMHVGMSDWDITLHEGFFREPWQLSLITDPYRGVLGIFRTQNLIPHQISCISVPSLNTNMDEEHTPISSQNGYLIYAPRPYPQISSMQTDEIDEDNNVIQ